MDNGTRSLSSSINKTVPFLNKIKNSDQQVAKKYKIQLIHIESKVTFYLYTVNNSYEIDNYIQLVNGIVTDFPERFLN